MASLKTWFKSHRVKSEPWHRHNQRVFEMVSIDEELKRGLPYWGVCLRRLNEGGWSGEVCGKNGAWIKADTLHEAFAKMRAIMALG